MTKRKKRVWKKLEKRFMFDRLWTKTIRPSLIVCWRFDWIRELWPCHYSIIRFSIDFPKWEEKKIKRKNRSSNDLRPSQASVSVMTIAPSNRQVGDGWMFFVSTGIWTNELIIQTSNFGHGRLEFTAASTTVRSDYGWWIVVASSYLLTDVNFLRLFEGAADRHDARHP